MSAIDTTAVESGIARLPAVLQDAARQWFEKFYSQNGDSLDAALDVETLVRLIASSEFAAGIILREWSWMSERIQDGSFDRPPDTASIGETAEEIVFAAVDVAELKSQLRRFRNRQLLHILWRTTQEQGAASSLAESLQSLSDLADVLIKTSVRAAESLLEPRFGLPFCTDNDRQIPLIVLAMGKLGGRELNFSSDIDLIFLYPEDGETGGPRRLSAHEYFVRLTRQIVALLDEVTGDGFVYRVDTRLRPFGESGPPVVSFAALETYLLQHGRGWERYAYIKSRPIATSNASGAVSELTQNLIAPFVYRRYLDYGVFESLRDMKALIATEVRKRQLAKNIKLGPGGIREIEFIVQSLQLVRGGGDESLRTSELQIVLPRLGHGKGISSAAVRVLSAAYNFLRRLENAIQALRDQQTHDLPEDGLDRARVLVAMNFADWTDLHTEFDRHREAVSELFDEIAFRTDSESTQSDLANSLSDHWTTAAGEAAWTALLQTNGYDQAENLAAILVKFGESLVSSKPGATAQKRLQKFIPALLVLVQERRQPHIACERVLNVAARIVRRSAYIALLNENPAAMRHLVNLCEKSAYLADEIARFPLLLDEMIDPRHYTQKITALNMQEDLAQRMQRIGNADSEEQIEILAQFQRANLFRIAVEDFSGNLPIMKVSDRLTDLAEIVLRQALDIAWRDLAGKHGVPRFTASYGRATAGLGIIAYGKMGGMELSYRSDLDLVFLHNSTGTDQETDGLKPLENSMFFARLVRRLVHFLTTQTGSGALYEVDTRLRPSGRSGLLVVNTEGFERYQDENAWTWEHQALLRSRPVAGSNEVGREFERIRSETLRNRVNREQLPGDVKSMRVKMREQLDQSTESQFDLKQGEGGVGDIEFLVQFLVLKNANRHPAVIHYTDNIRQLGALGGAALLSMDEANRLQEIYRAYRLKLHRLSLNGESPLVEAEEFAAERQFVTSVWHAHLN